MDPWMEVCGMISEQHCPVCYSTATIFLRFISNNEYLFSCEDCKDTFTLKGATEDQRLIEEVTLKLDGGGIILNCNGYSHTMPCDFLVYMKKGHLAVRPCKIHLNSY